MSLALLGGTPVRPEGPPAWPMPDPAVREALERAYADGDWGRYHGLHNERLRALLAAYHGCEHVHLCASGTAAVEFALRGVGVGPGDEVILAAYEFKASFQDILAIGAVPVLVDVRADDWQMDVTRLAAALSAKTKAILISYLHGGMVDVEGVSVFAMAHGLAVVEDACQMPGARIDGRLVGTWGDAGVLSFGGSKLTTAGRGGCVLTGKPDVAQRIRLHTNRGNDISPLSELQAAVLIPQWEQLDARNVRRREAVAFLRGEGRGERENGGLLRPFPCAAGAEPGYYKLGFQYDPARCAGVTRDRFAQAVRAEGIALDPGFRALHRIHSPKRFRVAGELTEAERADESVLTLHHPVLLGDERDWSQVLEAISKVAANTDQLGERGASA